MEMNALLKKYGLPAASVLASLVITVAGAVTNGKIQSALMEERIAVLQRDQARHELDKTREISRLSTASEDHGQRIIRLETSLDAIQTTLKEMRADIKTLIRGMRE